MARRARKTAPRKPAKPKPAESLDDRFKRLWDVFFRDLEEHADNVPSMFDTGTRILEAWHHVRSSRSHS